jgi:hypothetical protein
MVVAPFAVNMEDYTPPKHSRETLDFEEFAAKHSDSVPRWQARRLAISMSHSDTFETKILEF